MKRTVPYEEFVAVSSLLISSSWYESWLDHKDSSVPSAKRLALTCRLHAIMSQDRSRRYLFEEV